MYISFSAEKTRVDAQRLIYGSIFPPCTSNEDKCVAKLEKAAVDDTKRNGNPRTQSETRNTEKEEILSESLFVPTQLS
jgi:hypothetical protein